MAKLSIATLAAWWVRLSQNLIGRGRRAPGSVPMVASLAESIACGRQSARRMMLCTIRMMLVAGACAIAARASAQTPTPTPQLRLHLSTNKGCLEFGDAAEFAIGEQLVVFLRVDSPTVSQAAATLFSLRDNLVTV